MWDIALAEAQASVAEHATQRALAERQLCERQILVDQLSAQATDLMQQRDRLRAHLDQHQVELNTLRSERAGTQEHPRAVEDRAHQQVDHARQELKALQQRLEREQREHAKAIARFTTQQGKLRVALQKSEQNTASLSGQVAALETTVSQWQRAQAAASRRASHKTPAGTTAKSVRKQRLALGMLIGLLLGYGLPAYRWLNAVVAAWDMAKRLAKRASAQPDEVVQRQAPSE